MNFIVFSDDWGVHPSSCQHIFGKLSADHPTIWANTVGMRLPTPTLGDLKKAVRKIRGMLAPTPESPSRSGHGPTVCSPFMTPFQRPAFLERWNSRSVVRTVSRSIRDLGFQDYTLVTTVPNSHGFVKDLGAEQIIYYCVDDFSEWPGMDKETILAMEEKLLRHVDRIICTAGALHDRFKDDYPTLLLTHGVDVTHFSREVSEEHACLARIPRPRIGYLGLLDGRTDLDLVVDLATSLEEISFVFTGPTEGDLSRLEDRKNVHFTGPVPYDELPEVLHGWDACVLPYKVNSLTENINPLKLKEYLACGKPVITSALRETRALSSYLRIAESLDDWRRSIQDAIDGRATEGSGALTEFLRKESWEHKAEEFLSFCACVRT